MKAHTIQVCFIGDSFVAGIGDETGLGWAGRLLARQAAVGKPITAYNLGIRRNTSADILARCAAEVDARRSPSRETFIVLSMGVNDTTFDGGARRVQLEQSCANLERLLEDFSGDPVLVVGPPAIDDEDQNVRTAKLSQRFSEICGDRGVPFIDVFSELERDPVWRQQVRDGDGAHPGAAGYQKLYELVAPVWDGWLNGAGRAL